MSEYKTCKHVYDTGGTCNSAAATGRDYCVYHLRYRARQLRMAQYRARSERFDLKLPPIESMSTVMSALNHLIEAVAADMIDLKRADFLLKTLRFAAQSLKSSDKWQPSVFHTDVAAPAINLEAEYGLPENLDLDAPPEVAFPPPQPAETSSATPLSPAVGDRVGAVGYPIPPSFDRAPLFPDIPAPYVRDYNAEAEVAMFEATPEDMELNEILKEQGYKAFDRRAREHQRNADRRKQRKLFRANYERYAAEAKAKNIQRAAEHLLKERLAAEKATAQKSATEPSATKKPPASVSSDAPQSGITEGQTTA